MKKIVVRISLVVLLLGVVAFFAWPGDDGEQIYRTAKVTRGNIAEVVTANGTLNPLEIASVGTQVSGQVSKLHVQVNEEVKKGQLLAEIDPALLLTQLRQSKASLETIRASYELSLRNLQRKRELRKKDYISKVELETEEQSFLATKNSYESAKSLVEKDEVNLGYTKITAPIDGVIISLDVTQGQTLAANFQTPNLLKIAGDLAKMKIDVNFSEADISKVKVGLPVTFTVDAFPDREFSGVVKLVNLNPNNQSGVVTYSVTVEVHNDEKLLLPGMTAFVRVILSEQKDVLRVPVAALRFAPPVENKSGLARLLQFGPRGRGGFGGAGGNANTTPTIHLLRDGQLVAVEVKTGGTDETYMEISGEGVAEGDVVVTGLLPKRK